MLIVGNHYLFPDAQVETHKPGGTATDHGAAHVGEVTGAYP